ncbi:MAG TPA: CHAD domain-containing protein [Steroidobacteraceae bacterium]|nr:CHAD domain-containing protein [Steroidobacteraceae bacterium]
MAEELHRSESGTRRLAHIARAQIAAAIEALASRSPTDQVVHDARKELKRARATLRLLRDAIGDKAYRRENQALRDAARPLSLIRDRKVLLDTLNRLVKRFQGDAELPPTEHLRRVLRRERAATRRVALQGRKPFTSSRAMLQAVRQRAARWRTGSADWEVLGAGLKRVYGKGRKAMAAAQSDRTPAKLHEWRKQTKYLWHQLQLLEPLWPGMIGELADQAHKLSDYLGDDHDVSVLRDKVMELDKTLANSERRSLVRLIDVFRTELRDKAMVLGRRLYEESPTDFEARFAQYWRDWRRHR